MLQFGRPPNHVRIQRSLKMNIEHGNFELYSSFVHHFNVLEARDQIQTNTADLGYDLTYLS